MASLCEWRGNYQVEIVRPPRDTCDKSRHLNVNSPVTHSSNTLIRVLAGINEQTGDISILIGKGRRFSLRKIRGDLFTRWLWVWANIVGGEIFGIKLGYRMLTIRSSNQIFRYFQYISILGKMNYNRQMMKRVFKFFKFWNFFLDFRI